MNEKNSQISQQPEQEETGCLTALMRIFWMFIGSIASIFLLFFIIQRKSPVISDVVFWVLVFSLILVRYIDITRFKGQTSEGEPATLQHWKKYSIMVVLAACVLYAIAKVLAHFKVM